MVKGLPVSKSGMTESAKGGVVKAKRVLKSGKLAAAVNVANAGVYTQKRGERGKAMKFALETYQTVAGFKLGTRISYGPNPKTKGSKSWDRYNGYKDAKTVGEAIAKGSKVEDLMWEFDRGNYKVLGGERSEKEELKAIGAKAFEKATRMLASKKGPRGLAFKLQDTRGGEQLQKDAEWREARITRCEKLAQELKLKPEMHVDLKDELGIPEDRDCRLQRRVADELGRLKLQAADKSGKKITYDDIEEVLGCWGYKQNIGRINVMPEGQKYVYSDTVGMIRKRCTGYGLTMVTERYPNFVRFLTRWLTDNLPREVKDEFVCTAINLNANYAGKRHRDGGNEGPSVIRAFGKFTGGRLRYFAKDAKVKGKAKPPVESLDIKDSQQYDIKKNTLVFDGNRAHEVEAFKGNRYSIVYFSASGYMKVKPKDVKTLKKLGFPYPTLETMTALKKKTGADM